RKAIRRNLGYPPTRADQRCRSHRRPRREHYHARADLYSLVEVHDVLVCESDAARGYESPDGRGLVRAVDAVERVAQEKRAGAEGVAPASGHKTRQIGLAFDHLFGWIPIGPFRQPGNPFAARPSEAVAADPNAVTQSLAVAEHEIEIGVRGVDDDRAGRFLGVVIDQGATELRRQFLLRPGFGTHLGRQRRDGLRIATHQSGRHGIDLTRTGCAGVGSTDGRQVVITRWQRCIVVGINWRKRLISRKWIISGRRVCLRRVSFGWAGDGLSFRRWRWKWGRRWKLRGRWGNPAHCENQDDSAVEESPGHELLPLVAGHHSSIAAVSPITAVRVCSASTTAR